MLPGPGRPNKARHVSQCAVPTLPGREHKPSLGTQIEKTQDQMGKKSGSTEAGEMNVPDFVPMLLFLPLEHFHMQISTISVSQCTFWALLDEFSERQQKTPCLSL